MVDLMTVADWKPKSGKGAKKFWFEQDIYDRQVFALTWIADPKGHFDKFKMGTPTLDVFEILNDIGNLRSDIFNNGGVIPQASLIPLHESIVDETFDVVKYSPYHCGSWHALLKIRRPNKAENQIVVERPKDANTKFIRWPPAPGRGFKQIHAWLTQSININKTGIFDVGDTWEKNDEMLSFLSGMRHNGGFEAFASMMEAFVCEGFDARIINFFLRGLRGHGPTEAGKVHHLNELAQKTEADAVGIRSVFEIAASVQLETFPAQWKLVASPRTAWPAAVSDYFEHWRVGCGNHRPALTWLKQQLEARKKKWSVESDILAALGGTRATQKEVGVTIGKALKITQTVTKEVTDTIEKAEREGTSEAWTKALESSIEKVKTLSTTTGSGSSSTSGNEVENEFSVMAGAETGAVEQLLLGKISGEVTNTTRGKLINQYETHKSLEETSSSATTKTEKEAWSKTVEKTRERSLTLTKEFKASVQRSVEEAESLEKSVKLVIDLDGDGKAQRTQVLDGIEIALTAVNATLSGL